MKKIVALLLAVMMCVALVACGGGVDKQPAIDAFNEASTAFDEVAVMINADPEAYDQEIIDTMIEMSEVMSQHKALLEGDEEISQETLDEMIAWYGDVLAWVEDVKAVLETE